MGLIGEAGKGSEEEEGERWRKGMGCEERERERVTLGLESVVSLPISPSSYFIFHLSFFVTSTALYTRRKETHEEAKGRCERW